MDFDILEFECPKCSFVWLGKFTNLRDDVGTLILGKWKCPTCHEYGDILWHIEVRNASASFVAHHILTEH